MKRYKIDVQSFYCSCSWRENKCIYKHPRVGQAKGANGICWHWNVNAVGTLEKKMRCIATQQRSIRQWPGKMATQQRLFCLCGLEASQHSPTSAPHNPCSPMLSFCLRSEFGIHVRLGYLKTKDKSGIFWWQSFRQSFNDCASRKFPQDPTRCPSSFLFWGAVVYIFSVRATPDTYKKPLFLLV